MSPSSASPRYLLAQTQNPDGGWGYFPGKQSWLEPTAYAWLALHNAPGAAPALDRALALLLSWQRPDGGWSPNGQVKQSTWVTSLAVTVLAAARQTSEAPFQRGVEWLMGLQGVEGSWFNRVTASLGLVDPGRDLSLTGWPWLAGTSSWVEPTAHALTALRKAPGRTEIAARIDTGTKQIWSLRCADGGWNYGAPNALHVNLPSYPETTALALIGLAGATEPKLPQALQHARTLASQPQSLMAAAWLAIALRLHGIEPPAPGATPPIATPPFALSTPATPAPSTPASSSTPAAPGPETDLLVASLHALAEPTGNWHLLGGAH